jgi:UDP-N-acetylglucosamine 2-epimerase (non-hydrolysing)
MDRKNIHLICAARPNFMKVAPLYHALIREPWVNAVIVHTGQHYDVNMSDTFFQDLELPEPHIHLGIGSGTHAEQTGNVMIAYEKICLGSAPDLVVVVGDVNSTMACTIAAAKLGINVAHLEAGLRSFDRTMPEELNRLVTDSLVHLLWTHSPEAEENLKREGIPAEKIECVGNIMIDSLQLMLPKLQTKEICAKYNVLPQSFAAATLHRPSNVDRAESLTELCGALCRTSKQLPIILPLHPRTRRNLERFDLLPMLMDCPSLILTAPLPYREFLGLLVSARLAITDSGGIQEETSYLGIPCLTLRENTERPVTITQGTNRLIKVAEVEDRVKAILSDNAPKHPTIEYWDGKTAARVVASIKRFLGV